MTTTPTGGQKMPPGFFSRLSDADKLAMYEDAAFALVSGQQKKLVRHGDFYVEYHMASLPFIQRELTRLRAIVHKRHGFTVGIGPTTHFHPHITAKRFT